MVCEGVLYLFGTSSKEIEERTRERIKQEYLLEIRRLTEENQALIAENKRLEQLLIQHNIPF